MSVLGSHSTKLGTVVVDLKSYKSMPHTCSHAIQILLLHSPNEQPLRHTSVLSTQKSISTFCHIAVIDECLQSTQAMFPLCMYLQVISVQLRGLIYNSMVLIGHRDAFAFVLLYSRALVKFQNCCENKLSYYPYWGSPPETISSRTALSPVSNPETVQ